MDFLNVLLNDLLLKIYFFFVSKEEVIVSAGEDVIFKTRIEGTDYSFTFTEITYTVISGKWFIQDKVNYLYKVSMLNESNQNLSSGVYPLLCSRFLVSTRYHLMLAMHHHYMVNRT